MIRSAGLVILLVVAALFGAPSRAFAAQNSLLAGQVSPGSGTATTVFTFTVSYDGRFATTGVRTNVAGLSIPMVRVSGTSTAGTWSTASVLPPGTWQVTFRATTTQGHAPTLSGGIVTVAGGVTPPPSSGGGPSPEIIPGPEPTPPSSEAPAPVATPAPSSGGTGGPTEPEATPPTGIVTASPGTHSGAGSGSGAGGGTSGAPADASARPSAHPSAGSGSVAEPGEDADRSPSSIGRAGTAGSGLLGTASNGLLGVVLVVGLSGVAAVAAIGSAFLLASRRRAARPADLAAGDAPPTAASDAIDAALERRTLRRARMRLDDDPIVAAMGLGGGKRPAPRRRAGQTGAGPGERPRRGG